MVAADLYTFACEVVFALEPMLVYEGEGSNLGLKYREDMEEDMDDFRIYFSPCLRR